MAAAIGDFFPKQDKKEFAKRNIIAGNVVKCHSDIANKDKRLLIIGISTDMKRVATLCFNTEKYFTKNKTLSSLEICFESSGREYLDHKSFLNCSKIEIIPYKLIYERLVTNPEDLKGSMNKKDLDSVCTTAVNAHTAIPRDIIDFDLTSYKLQAKP